ncbi:MAG TPA: sigma-70 family RNA polymerase sigma factor [Acidobacteriota bacterium]|nr:sigma-70 family RNA polymerase sigma factor [Acidobacteriota bacterium]
MEHSEQMLVDKVLSGDQEACMRLVNNYSRMVGTVIWRATGDDRIVEDLSQETFLRVFRAMAYFDSRGKLSTWIYTIANRVAIDHLRKTKRWREESPADESASDMEKTRADLESPDPENALAHKEIRDVIRDELAQLPEAYRLALVYTAIDELDYQTVAGMMNIPVGTLKTYVFRGKKILKDRITHAMQGRSATTCK